MERACWLLLASAGDEAAVCLAGALHCSAAVQLSCPRAWKGASHRQCTASLCWSGRQLLHNACAATGLRALLPLTPAPHKLWCMCLLLLLLCANADEALSDQPERASAAPGSRTRPLPVSR